MDTFERSKLIMLQASLNLINYVKDNNITVIRNDDWYIINLICNTQCQLNEYIVLDAVGPASTINNLKNDSLYRQTVIRQLLSIASDGIVWRLEEFSHITKEYLNSLTIL